MVIVAAIFGVFGQSASTATLNQQNLRDANHKYVQCVADNIKVYARISTAAGDIADAAFGACISERQDLIIARIQIYLSDGQNAVSAESFAEQFQTRRDVEYRQELVGLLLKSPIKTMR